jgi:hypothetical protein
MADTNPEVIRMKQSGDIAGLSRALRTKGMQMDAAIALGEMGAVGIEPLMKALAERKGMIRAVYALGLKKIGEPAIQPLLKALDDPNLDQGAAATLMLMASEIQNKELLHQMADVLMAHASTFNPNACVCILSALGSIGEKLKDDKDLIRRIGSTLLRYKEDGDSDVRKNVKEVQEKLGFEMLPTPDCSAVTCPNCHQAGKVDMLWMMQRREEYNKLYAYPRKPSHNAWKLTTVMIIGAVLGAVLGVLLVEGISGLIDGVIAGACLAAALYYGYLQLTIRGWNPLVNAMIKSYERRKANWDKTLYCENCSSAFLPDAGTAVPITRLSELLNK